MKSYVTVPQLYQTKIKVKSVMYCLPEKTDFCQMVFLERF